MKGDLNDILCLFQQEQRVELADLVHRAWLHIQTQLQARSRRS